MLSTYSLSIGNENVGEAISKLAPRDVAKLDGVGIGGDFLGEGLGLGAEEEDDFFGIFGGEIGGGSSDGGDRDQGRRGGGVLGHVGDALNCPATVA